MSDELELPPEVFAVFREEAREHLAVVATHLATLEAGPPPAGAKALLHDLARRLHSLKGSAAGLGLEAIARVAHAAETLLQRGAESAPPPHLLQGLYKATAWLQEGIGEAQPPADGILRELGALAAPASAPEAPAGQPPVPAPGPPVPAPGPPVPTRSETPTAWNLPRPGPPTQKERRKSAPAPIAGDDFVRVRTQALDKLLGPLSTLAGERAESRRRADRLSELRETVARLARKAEGEPLTPGDADELRVLADRLGEEIAAHKRVSHHLARAVGSLERELQQLRLVSLSSLSDALRLSARDAALRTGKVAEFSVEGEGVKVDRRTLEELRAPLVHLVRNAIDHGIEAPQRRTAAGKPQAGRVTLRCGSDGTMVSLSVEDDGAGIDLDALREAAKARGLLAGRDDAPLTPDDVWRLISSPGFSTRTTVSEVSGRGVGMDVVDAAVRKLGGLGSVWSLKGHGARFTLRLPASVLTSRVLLVRVGGQTFALPLSGVEGSRTLPSSARYQTGGRALVEVGGRTARLRRLGEERSPGPEERLKVVLVQTASTLAALAVDEILGEEEVAVRPLGPPVRRLRGVVGSTVVESGKVVVVLDPRELLELDELARPAPAATDAPRASGRVLVVDDSITTRTLERHILERNGYSVRLANDGVEALAALRAGPVDVVVSDVEMPNLDGLGLARAMRADPALEKIPLILVTSLGNDDDRRRGLAAGAQAYLVKSRFDQERLLAAIHELLAAKGGVGG